MAESGEEAAEVRQVCGCDVWQLGSDRLLPDPSLELRNRRNHCATGGLKRSALNGEGQRCPLTNDLTQKSRPGRARQRHSQVFPDQRCIAGNHHRLEVAGP
jgi:hypothetical protein